jgi:hypothetical protein
MQRLGRVDNAPACVGHHAGQTVATAAGVANRSVTSVTSTSTATSDAPATDAALLRFLHLVAVTARLHLRFDQRWFGDGPLLLVPEVNPAVSYAATLAMLSSISAHHGGAHAGFLAVFLRFSKMARLGVHLSANRWCAAGSR